MTKVNLFKTSLWLVIFIFLLNSLAMKFFWYYSLWWFDMPMHFLGGVFIGLLSIAVCFNYFGKQCERFKPYQVVLASFLTVLIIGFFWEMFELSIDKFITYNPHNLLDTVSDLLFDVSGGLLASLYFLAKSGDYRYNNLHE